MPLPVAPALPGMVPVTLKLPVPVMTLIDTEKPPPLCVTEQTTEVPMLVAIDTPLWTLPIWSSVVTTPVRQGLAESDPGPIVDVT